jgi:hypothetical protein
VVEHALDGPAESLKERSLGVEVFGRDPNYDTSQDPVVRSTAGEVRKRLAQYYLEPGRLDEIRITLPPGSYSPEIHPPTEITVPAATIRLTGSRWRWWWIAAGVMGIAALGAVLLFAPFLRDTGLDRFWAPLIKTSSLAVMCVGQPRAYKIDPEIWREVETKIEKSSNPENTAALASIPFKDITPTWDRHFSLVDVQAMLPLCQILTRKGKKIEIRGARVSSLADLRGKTCIFIGAFNNDWTMRLTSEMRFYFEQGSGANSMVIRDRRDPNRKGWAGSRNWPAPVDLATDYAIVTRAFNPTIEQTFVTVAGATGYGTYAAGELLVNEEYFAAALRDAPRGWDRMSMQVVLSVKVISGIAGPPKVLATYFW